MSLTVRELIAIPTLGLRTLAGDNGLDRVVDWAHSCELPEPWQWLGNGDLLMTVGHGFPAEPEGQVAYLQRLVTAEMSGLVLAEGLFSPPVTADAAEVAQELGFPILEAAFEVPFVLIAHAVGDSNQREAQARLNRVLRMYDTFRRSIADHPPDDELFAALSRDLGADLWVMSRDDCSVLVSSGGELPLPASAEVSGVLRQRREPLPAVLRLEAEQRRYLVLPLGAGNQWVLLASAAESVIDLVVLQHAATIAYINVDRRNAAAIARLHSAGRLLTQITQGRMDSELAVQQLSDFGVDGPPWWIVLVEPRQDRTALVLQRELLEAQVPHILDRGEDAITIICAVPPDDPRCRALLGRLCTRIGVSEPVNAVSRLPEATREARWALRTATRSDEAITHHGADQPLFLPRTVAEGDAAVSRVLGPIVDYDADHATELLRSLEVFFDCQRSWQTASQVLGIHKQSLVYRIRRIEEITGRKLDSLDDIAEVHLALRTRALLRSEETQYSSRKS